MAANINKFAIEYDNECAMPRISVGNSSAVIVHGIVSNPNIEQHTYNNRQTTGTQLMPVCPEINSVNIIWFFFWLFVF